MSSSTTSVIQAKYGEWKSPITSQFIIQGNCKSICELQAREGTAFWIEQTFPAGKRVLFESGSEGVRWSPEGVNCTNQVHEYGGGSFCVRDKVKSVFICQKGGIYELSEALSDPRPIVDIEKVRHADPFIYGDFIYAVQERHDNPDGGEPKNLLIRANVKTCKVEVVAEGADFYAEPRVSPDGKYLVWIQWNKPYMPWDETSVYIRELTASSEMGEPKQLLTGGSYFGLQWNGNAKVPELFVVSDVSGYWNIYSVDFNGGSLKQNVYPIEKDIGGPLWQFADDRPFAVDSDHFVIAVADQLLFRSELTSKFVPIESARKAGFTVFSFLTISNGKLFTITTGPTKSLSLIEVNLKSLETTIIREVRSSEQIRDLDLSVPRLKSFDSDGVKVEGHFYPPKNSNYAAPKGSLPPVIFFAHPGPTMNTNNGLNFKIQYFTSKGFAVFDINYRGSTGYGRQFRNLLLDNWGVVDTNDMINGAKHLIAEKLVDPKKICIVGSSAGGFLVLSTLFHPENVFSAAVSIYGVSDLEDIFNVFIYYFLFVLV